MKARTTVILLLLLGGVFAVIRWLGPPEPEKRTFQPLFPGLEREAIERLELRLVSGEEIALRRTGTTLFEVRIRTLREPIIDRADETRVRTLLEALVTALREDLSATPDRATLRELGLTEDAVFIRIESRGKRWELRLGRDDPEGNACFAQLVGSEGVFRTGRNLKNILGFNAQNFRFDRVFTLANIGIDALQVDYPPDTEHPDGLLLMLEQTALGWRLTEPFEARADDARVAAAVNSLSRAPIVSWIAEKPSPEDLRKYGLEQPIHVTLGCGAALETVQFGIWDEAGGMVYARKVDHENVVGVDAGSLEALRRDPDTFRARRLLRPVGDLFTALVVTAHGQLRYEIRSVGRGQYQIVQPFQCLAEPEGETDSVRWLLRRLEDATATGFVDAGLVAGATPAGTLHVRWRERDVPLHVTLGVYERDGSVLVQRDDEPSVLYEVGRDLLDVLRVHPVQLKERRLVPFDKDWGAAVVRAALVVGEESLEIERGPGRYFVAVGDARRRTANLQSFFGALVHRRALRFLAPADDESSSEPPDLGELRARLVLHQENGVTLRLELLGKTAEGNYLRLTLVPDPSQDVIAIVDDDFARDFLGAIRE
ncbi:MAG: DUF4340 domain-containing protein [Planctomycetota bacterium]